MKTFITSFILFFSEVTFGQTTKWIIQFTDKNNSPFSISNPSSFLSAEAIARRAKSDIKIDSSDIPVNASYIQQVLATGSVLYLNQSKWLNQILVECSDQSAMDAIRKLPFVKNTSVSNFSGEPVIHRTNRFTERTASARQVSSLSASIQTDTLSYGTSAGQITIHHGEFLHGKGYTGKGITIAFLDAGFYHYKQLTAFDSIRLKHQVLGEKDFVTNDNSVDEDDPHGMYCLSTVAANVPGSMIGSAPDASFWLLRSENTASESPAEEQNWVAAAEFADSAGADMISSSVGYYHFDDSTLNHDYADIYANSTIVSRGAAMAVRKGMIVTNSAGNEGTGEWRYILFPADADSVCSVGAVDSAGEIAAFSSYGYPGKVKPDIVSVGVNTTIWGIDDHPANGSGTSFSNPNVSGLIACLWQAFPAYNNMTILQAVYQSADRFDHPDDHYGYGIPDMQKAYLIMKKKQNSELYGNEWLFADPHTFTDTIHIKLIGRIDGPANIFLQDFEGRIIRSVSLVTEQEEIYDSVFTQLSVLPAGEYMVRYTDSTLTKSIIVTKETEMTSKDWITAMPVPFSDQLTVYLQSPETGKIYLKLIDGSGRMIETKQLDVVRNDSYNVVFNSAASLPPGIYFIQYAGSIRKTIKVLK